MAIKLKTAYPVILLTIVLLLIAGAIIYASYTESRESQSGAESFSSTTAPDLIDYSQEPPTASEQTPQNQPSKPPTQQPPTPATSEEFWLDAQLVQKNSSDEDSTIYTVDVKRNMQGSNVWGVLTIDVPVSVFERQLESGKRYSFKGTYTGGVYRASSVGMIFCPDCEQ